jgi:TrmH family RNA methyltransferase
MLPDRSTRLPVTAAPLTSTRSPRVQAVRRLTRRSARVAERRFVVEGPQAVREALGTLVELYADPDGLERHAELLAAAACPVTPVSRDVLAAMAETVSPQGLDRRRAAARRPARARAGGWRPAGRRARGGERPGQRRHRHPHRRRRRGRRRRAHRRLDRPARRQVRARDGRQPVAPAGGVRSPAGAAVQALRAAGLTVLATTGAGEHDLDDLQDRDQLSGPTAWLLGSEAAGLSEQALALATAPSGSRCTVRPSR